MSIPQLPPNAPNTQPIANRPVVASYTDYLEAQRAVDYLSDEKFAVENVGIVGRDLRFEEAVYGRLDWQRALTGGLVQGLMLGVFVGILISVFANTSGGVILGTALLGLVYGVVFGGITYAMSGGRRDFVSRSAITAGSYDVVCTWAKVDEAKSVLASMPAVHS
jgi:hypothetical protein